MGQCYKVLFCLYTYWLCGTIVVGEAPRQCSMTAFSIVILSITEQAECHYAECRILFIVVLSAVMSNIVVLSVVMLSVVAALVTIRSLVQYLRVRHIGQY